eukprot:c45442_g1_i1.p1 GENE.c45442_g1_i1~~c45442_g1_i1.p1  ORF type:complete len:614 (-),score=138.00 c45442_g1_i1:111-1931(-)
MDRRAFSIPTHTGPRGPLYHHQANLPRLPVPSLPDTCFKLLRSARALAKSDAEFAELVKDVEDLLLSGVGDSLHKKLLAHARERNKHSSWLIDWWNDWAYFSYRDSVVINVSYYYMFKENIPNLTGPSFSIAARLVTAALSFRHQILTEALEPEPSRLGPAICASMYPFLFNACRIPLPERDQTHTFSSQHSHIIVVRNGSFFSFDVFPGGQQLSVLELEHQFQEVIRAGNEIQGVLPIGLLTSDNRDNWAVNRSHLLKLGNEPTLDVIESAILVVCLDSNAPSTLEERAHNLLHGTGTNRWFDKPIEFIVSDNGKAGFLGEHSVMDGTPTLRMCDYCLNSIASGKFEPSNFSVAPRPLAPPTPLRWHTDSQVNAALDVARSNLDEAVAIRDLNVLQFKGFGAAKIKTMGVSPDAFAQMAIQLANYRHVGEHVGTYESCQTRSFLHGRTEVIRSCSVESNAFCEAMQSANTPASVRYAALKAASDAHMQYATDASTGRGVDRHFLGLRLIAGKDPLPRIYSNNLFKRSCHWRLSTSALPCELFDAWGFGEVVPDGFGVGYMVLNNQLNFSVVSRKLGAKGFTQALEQAMRDMEGVCANAKVARAKM